MSIDLLEIGLFRGLLTLALFLAFLGLWIWAWSGKRKSEFDAAAQMPLQDIDTSSELSQRS
jgi:cytochrome c oxidase cbb3-type subunit IV